MSQNVVNSKVEKVMNQNYDSLQNDIFILWKHFTSQALTKRKSQVNLWVKLW
jgi:hypothetical protein